MLCDRCHENEAVINFTEIRNGQKRELHLCESCASEETGIEHPLLSLTDTSFLANLLASVLGRQQQAEEVRDEDLKKSNIVCPSCRMTYDEFLKYGTFGCPECYKTFNFLLDGYLKKIQGNCEHAGKKPLYSRETLPVPSLEEVMGPEPEPAAIEITVDEASTEEELKAALKRAVAREEYEEAARIRDILRSDRKGDDRYV